MFLLEVLGTRVMISYIFLHHSSFSAYLRQPKSTTKQERWKYVENVIKVLGMEDFSEAIVGVPGEG